jgi:hypothetical protein
VLLGCTGLLLAGPAWAHGVDASPLWGGALHVLTSPLALAALLGLVAALFGIEEQLCFSVAAMTAVTAASAAVLTAVFASYLAGLAGAGSAQTGGASVSPAGGRFLVMAWANFSPALAPLGVVLVGLAALVGWRHTQRAALGLAILAGITAGIAAQLDNGRWQSVLGLTGCVALITIVGLIAFHELKRFSSLQSILPIARRVLGSWVMALGLLLAVLAVRNGLNGLGWLK